MLHLALCCFSIGYVLSISKSVSAIKQPENGIGIPVRLGPRSPVNVQQVRFDECTAFKYDTNGILYGCGYSIDIFRATTLHTSRVSLASYLLKTHLAALEHRAHPKAVYDVRSAANISFAFESGTKQLFTAWGPDLQLRYVYTSDGFDIFDNIDKNRPSYHHKCAPFCAIVRITENKMKNAHDHQSAPANLNKYTESYKSFNNESAFQVSDYTLRSTGEKISHATQLAIDQCEDCNFGFPSQSCPDIVRTCLTDEFSCSRRPTYQPDETSFFCMGVYHVFLNPKTAFCPLSATVPEMYMYGICDCIYIELKTKIDSGEMEIMVYEPPSSVYGSKLSTVERNSGSPIHVLIRGPPRSISIMRKAIDKAIRKGDISRKDKHNIDADKTIASIKCKPSAVSEYKEQCSVDIILKKVIER